MGGNTTGNAVAEWPTGGRVAAVVAEGQCPHLETRPIRRAYLAVPLLESVDYRGRAALGSGKKGPAAP